MHWAEQQGQQVNNVYWERHGHPEIIPNTVYAQLMEMILHFLPFTLKAPSFFLPPEVSEGGREWGTSCHPAAQILGPPAVPGLHETFSWRFGWIEPEQHLFFVPLLVKSAVTSPCSLVRTSLPSVPCRGCVWHSCGQNPVRGRCLWSWDLQLPSHLWNGSFKDVFKACLQRLALLLLCSCWGINWIWLSAAAFGTFH